MGAGRTYLRGGSGSKSVVFIGIIRNPFQVARRVQEHVVSVMLQVVLMLPILVRCYFHNHGIIILINKHVLEDMGC